VKITSKYGKTTYFTFSDKMSQVYKLEEVKKHNIAKGENKERKSH
jgi:hypothetical protein